MENRAHDTLYGVFDGEAGDKIDLRLIDADANSRNGDQAFAYVWNGGFRDAGGEISVTEDEGRYVVRLDTDNDAAAEMSFYVGEAWYSKLTKTDFLL